MAGTLLTVEGLTKRFGGLLAVDEVSFTVEPGELIGIIGPNGAGKTTLFHLLTGFLPPDRGRIVFKDRRLDGLRPHRIVDRGMTRTFQVVRPFTHMTVIENVATACASPRARRASGGQTVFDQAMGWLAAVGLEGKAGLLVDNLPFGDLKRTEIARALATHPEVLLLDEPFSGLGASEVVPLLELIGALPQQDITILVVEHKMRELMRLARRVIVMHYGRIISQGSPAVVARDPAVVEAYLGGTA